MPQSSTLLYHEDAYQTEFKAAIVDHRTVDDLPAIALDATCFYPASGGQPCDHGTINGIQVVDVLKDDVEIIHVLNAPITDSTVHGKITWAGHPLRPHATAHRPTHPFQYHAESPGGGHRLVPYEQRHLHHRHYR